MGYLQRNLHRFEIPTMINFFGRDPARDCVVHSDEIEIAFVDWKLCFPMQIQVSRLFIDSPSARTSRPDSHIHV